jgi:hypothetical protein
MLCLKITKTKVYDTIRLRTSIVFQTLAATRDTKSVTQDVRVEYILLTEKYIPPPRSTR